MKTKNYKTGMLRMVTGDLSPETDRSETLQHCSGRSEVSGRFGTSTEVSKSQFVPKYQTV